MTTIRIREMFGHVIQELHQARNSLAEAASWARSDWSDRRDLTMEEARAQWAVFEAVRVANNAIDRAKGAIDRAYPKDVR